MQLDKNFFNSNYTISYLGNGEIGGKAKGLEFINNSISSAIKENEFPKFEVSIPKMVVIRTDVFDLFMKSNKLYEIALSDLPDHKIALAFQKADLPFNILGDLRLIVTELKRPLAIRSSSLLEDSVNEPFAGIYGTKMTPNNQVDVDSRFRKLTEAIKYVYASTFFKAPKNYINATKHKTENEKMAVIIQEIIGNKHNESFYPEVSGVARSYNFYPQGNINPKDGIVNLALGLGKTIVDGGVSWSYSPAFPQNDPPFKTIGDMLKQTQLNFWAVNLGKQPGYDPINETEYMCEKHITDAEEDGTLKQIVSTYDMSSDRIWPGQSGKGPRILTFAPILKSNDIPLNNLLKKLLKICEEVYNSPIEIEFAVTIDPKKAKPFKLGFLQVRPMVVSSEEVNIEEDEMSGENVLLSSKSVLGNGSNSSLKDIIFLKSGDFKTKDTYKIAKELEEINKSLVSKNKQYLLIGFGRWGTTDPWAGIPVDWGQISGAKVIVEASIEGMIQEMSQASHFFHNVTSFQVSYFSIPYSSNSNVDWKWLNNLKISKETELIKHVVCDVPLDIKVDGRTGYGLIKKLQ